MMCTVCHDHRPRITRPSRTTAAPLKLQPLQLALALPGEIEDNAIDRRSLTGSGDSSCCNNRQGASSGDHRGCETCRVGVLGDTQYGTGAVTSPSLDILTCDYRRAGSDTVATEPIEVVAPAYQISATDGKTRTTMGIGSPSDGIMCSASGSLMVKEGERTRDTRVGHARTTTTSQESEVAEKGAEIGGGTESDNTRPVDPTAHTPNTNVGNEKEVGDRRDGKHGRKGGRKEIRGEYGEGEVGEGGLARNAISKEGEEREDPGEEARYGHGARGGRITSTSRKATNKGKKSRTMIGKDYRGCVLPLTLPGEAHETKFGAAARAVVLASGSSRFMVSR